MLLLIIIISEITINIKFYSEQKNSWNQMGLRICLTDIKNNGNRNL